jgi:hypothetical protein
MSVRVIDAQKLYKTWTSCLATLIASLLGLLIAMDYFGMPGDGIVCRVLHLEMVIVGK